MKLTQILAALPKLNKQEIATVKAAAEHLLGGLNTETTDVSVPLYEAIAAAVGSRLSYQVFQGTGTYKVWKRNSKVALSFIDETFVGVHKATRMAMMTFLAHALLDDLRQRDIPISINSMTTNLGRLPEVFEDAFPAYKQSGMVDLIIKSMERRRGGQHT